MRTLLTFRTFPNYNAHLALIPHIPRLLLSPNTKIPNQFWLYRGKNTRLGKIFMTNERQRDHSSTNLTWGLPFHLLRTYPEALGSWHTHHVTSKHPSCPTGLHGVLPRKQNYCIYMDESWGPADLIPRTSTSSKEAKLSPTNGNKS